mmetsp:Transcript_10540/g.23210  ORF Transcript_10540/g.23210 Transcript_10540/m.23210 type:complete len:238 (-) Transcript_10540:320-1033(-)
MRWSPESMGWKSQIAHSRVLGSTCSCRSIGWLEMQAKRLCPSCPPRIALLKLGLALVGTTSRCNTRPQHRWHLRTTRVQQARPPSGRLHLCMPPRSRLSSSRWPLRCLRCLLERLPPQVLEHLRLWLSLSQQPAATSRCCTPPLLLPAPHPCWRPRRRPLGRRHRQHRRWPSARLQCCRRRRSMGRSPRKLPRPWQLSPRPHLQHQPNPLFHLGHKRQMRPRLHHLEQPRHRQPRRR